ncbi:MAG: PepSY domain-containing protein [Flavobacteriaceae bacterium]
MGFYVFLFALVIAFTGTMISYNWLKYVIYISTGGEKEAHFIVPENVGSIDETSLIKPIDFLIAKLWKHVPDAEGFEVHYAKTTTESIYVEVANSKGLFYNPDFRFFNQNTLEEIETSSIYGKYENAKVADKILRMHYDIHVGTIGGIIGKIIAFMVSLVVASLPVTGGLLWYKRNYKRKREAVKIDSAT